MAEKLDRLSAQQLALLADVRDQWLAVGLAAASADRPQAERGARLAYQAAGLPVPPLVLWLRSPLEGVLGLTTLRRKFQRLPLRHLNPVQNQLGPRVKSNVDDQIKNRVGDQVEHQVLDQVWDQVSSVEREIRTKVGGQLRDQITDQDEGLPTDLTDQVRKQVEDQIEAQVGHRQADHLLGHRRRLAGREDLHAATLLGQHDAVQLAFYDAFRRLGIGAADRLEGLMAVARAAGWWWAFRGLVVLTERPCHLHRDREGRLHGDSGPALLYPDGFGIWAWHGVRVPREVIERRLEPGRIARESNVEVHRVMIERYGLERYLRAVDATKLDEVHEPPFPGLLDARLWRAEIVGDEPLCMVELVNSTPEPDGSARSYMLRVPPDVQTAHQAVAWTWGMAEHEYHPAVES